MRLRKRKSSLDDWLDRGTTPEKFWKLLFYFFSRFILVFCILHYFGVAYPDSRWEFPGPASVEFWACCVLFAAIFATVFYVVRGRRNVSAAVQGGLEAAQKQIPLRPSPQVDGGPRSGNDRKQSNDDAKSSPVKVAEEKREGRYGGVGRATFMPEPESEEERSEHEGDRRQ